MKTLQLVQTLETRTTLAMTQRMQASLRILHMNNSDLTDFLTEKAQENPYVELRLPSSGGGEDFDRIAALQSKGPSLYTHIADQIELTFDTPRLRRIAFALLEALEPSGWMTTPLTGIAMTCRVPEDLVTAVLLRMQGFEPSGIFARSLSECLRLQAEDQGVLTWELQALIDNLDLLVAGKNRQLADICDCEPEDIPEIAAMLRQFDPKPGQRFDDDRPPVFPPDLTAKQVQGGWRVELNRSSLPGIEVADPKPIDRSQEEARKYRAQALSEARWLASTLIRRQTTLLQTATAIIAHQSAFLDGGPGALRPLALADIAETLELHPSTISRAIAGRMIDTPIGALPLKSFFSRTFPNASGANASGPNSSGCDEHSQDAVLQLVRKIISAENPEQPLSDSAIATLAKNEGITIARRTVAKFRGILGIASSYDRRKQAVLA